MVSFVVGCCWAGRRGGGECLGKESAESGGWLGLSGRRGREPGQILGYPARLPRAAAPIHSALLFTLDARTRSPVK